jgi:hypothetical protein
MNDTRCFILTHPEFPLKRKRKEIQAIDTNDIDADDLEYLKDLT